MIPGEPIGRKYDRIARWISVVAAGAEFFDCSVITALTSQGWTHRPK